MLSASPPCLSKLPSDTASQEQTVPASNGFRKQAWLKATLSSAKHEDLAGVRQVLDRPHAMRSTRLRRSKAASIRKTMTTCVLPRTSAAENHKHGRPFSEPQKKQPATKSAKVSRAAPICPCVQPPPKKKTKENRKNNQHQTAPRAPAQLLCLASHQASTLALLPLPTSHLRHQPSAQRGRKPNAWGCVW